MVSIGARVSLRKPLFQPQSIIFRNVDKVTQEDFERHASSQAEDHYQSEIRQMDDAGGS